MTTAALVAVLALVGTLVTGGVTWLIARHNAAGSVAVSEAATLWAESQTIRGELRVEATNLRTELIRLQDVLVRVRHDASACAAEVIVLKARIAVLEQQIKGCRHADDPEGAASYGTP